MGARLSRGAHVSDLSRLPGVCFWGGEFEDAVEGGGDGEKGEFAPAVQDLQLDERDQLRGFFCLVGWRWGMPARILQLGELQTYQTSLGGIA